MMQKGPGEGYRAAKADALAIEPSLKCEGVHYGLEGRARIIGYVIRRDGETLGKAVLARDAWCEALSILRRGKDHRGFFS